MPATDVKFGITRHEGALIETLETSDKIEKKVLKGSDGVDARVKAFNTTTSFSVKGHGSLTVAVGIGDPEIDGISGGVSVIEELKKHEQNDDFDGWEYSGTNHPEAEDV